MEAIVPGGKSSDRATRNGAASTERINPERLSAFVVGRGPCAELRNGDHHDLEEGATAMSRRGKKEKDLDELIADSRRLRDEFHARTMNLHRFTNNLQEQVEAFIEEERAIDGDDK